MPGIGFFDFRVFGLGPMRYVLDVSTMQGDQSSFQEKTIRARKNMEVNENRSHSQENLRHRNSNSQKWDVEPRSRRIDITYGDTNFFFIFLKYSTCNFGGIGIGGKKCHLIGYSDQFHSWKFEKMMIISQINAAEYLNICISVK